MEITVAHKTANEGRVSATMFLLGIPVSGIFLSFSTQPGMQGYPEFKFVFPEDEVDAVVTLANLAESKGQLPTFYAFQDSKHGVKGYTVIARFRLAQAGLDELKLLMDEEDATDLIADYPAPEYLVDVMPSSLFRPEPVEAFYGAMETYGRFRLLVGCIVGGQFREDWAIELKEFASSEPQP